ncbi:cytochrome C [Aromatoleum petrolei]|uniref:Cytochrome C n=1 Tax=Aromatoleum petrolei TaxID=76116 RepID=A0ABX1MR57_9RHOO|nr:cytochrome C [Aromatoleum petrolei]NMF89176.1 cytochrome C [Aromatoleum petrolei]QTQ36506.1 Putative cytochrome c [Aromatoleum petrolei]
MKTAARLVLSLLACAAATAVLAADPAAAERGRYLVSIAGCNDCHTEGYAQSDGKVPEPQWLTGSAVGFSGPWGVSYPGNLRLVAAMLDEAGWLERVRQGGLPPMPWSSLRAMSESDLLAIYRYLRDLGAAGEPAPQAVAPGQPIATPHFVFVPQPPQPLKTGALAR